MEMRNLVLCVLLKFEEPVKQKIPESGVQGAVGVGVEVLEVIISTWGGVQIQETEVSVDRRGVGRLGRAAGKWKAVGSNRRHEDQP